MNILTLTLIVDTLTLNGKISQVETKSVNGFLYALCRTSSDAALVASTLNMLISEHSLSLDVDVDRSVVTISCK